RAVALGEALAVGAQNHGNVRELRQLRSQRVENVDLPRRVVDVVVAADYVRDVHVEVVHDDPEVVRRDAVLAQQDEVVELAVRDGDRPFLEIVKSHLALERVLEADDRRDAWRRRGLRIAPASGSPVGTHSISKSRFSFARLFCKSSGRKEYLALTTSDWVGSSPRRAANLSSTNSRDKPRSSPFN